MSPIRSYPANLKAPTTKEHKSVAEVASMAKQVVRRPATWYGVPPPRGTAWNFKCAPTIISHSEMRYRLNKNVNCLQTMFPVRLDRELCGTASQSIDNLQTNAVKRKGRNGWTEKSEKENNVSDAIFKN